MIHTVMDIKQSSSNCLIVPIWRFARIAVGVVITFRCFFPEFVLFSLFNEWHGFVSSVFIGLLFFIIWTIPVFSSNFNLFMESFRWTLSLNPHFLGAFIFNIKIALYVQAATSIVYWGYNFWVAAHCWTLWWKFVCLYFLCLCVLWWCIYFPSCHVSRNAN